MSKIQVEQLLSKPSLEIPCIYAVNWIGQLVRAAAILLHYSYWKNHTEQHSVKLTQKSLEGRLLTFLSH